MRFQLVNGVILVGPCLTLDSMAFADSFTEDWYLMRGQANMKIGNYRGAIEANEKAHEQNPGNQQIIRSLGLAYGRDGLF